MLGFVPLPNLQKLCICRNPISKGETQQIKISRIFVQPLIIMIASGASLLTVLSGVDTGYCDTGCWFLGAGFWVLGTGYWVLGSGCWVLGAGYWVLVSGWTMGFRYVV
jgi:hypothetical protein